MKEKFIDKKIYNESIRTTTVSVDNDVIWTGDRVIGGLYIIDKETYEVKNILDSFEIYRFGVFWLQSIFQWNNYIVLMPYELNKNWVIYNKKDGKVQYRNVVNLRGSTSGIYIIGKYGYMTPSYIGEPIIVIDLEAWIVCRIIKNWSENIEGNSKNMYELRKGVIVNLNIYFNLYDSKCIIKVGQKNVDIYKVDIPYGIACIDYSNEKFWILPTKGNYIYNIDINGKLVETIELKKNNNMYSANEFIKIIATEKYIFLLPVTNKKILVYVKDCQKFRVIDTDGNELKNKFLGQYRTSSYWQYYIENNKLYLLPIENRFLEIDLYTLEWKGRDIYLPKTISGHGLAYWFGWNCGLTTSKVNKEIDKNLLTIYCEMIHKSTMHNYDKQIGKKIWGKL